jgi:hypothetical protein
MKQSLNDELLEAIAYDKKYNLGYYDGGKTTLVQSRINTSNKLVDEGIHKICTNYGVLPSIEDTLSYQQKVLSGELSITKALQQFKKELYAI